jgi:hypothetical protein
MRVGDTCAKTISDIIGDGSTESVTVLTECAPTIIGSIFAASATIFSLILQSKIKTIDQPKEITIPVCS